MTAPSAAELLGHLQPSRRAHSQAVAVTAAAAGLEHIPAEHLADLTMAATLHDIGYVPEWAHTGFHPIDGARHLRALGFSDLVCHLVATHTGARLEAAQRGFEPHLFDEFAVPGHIDADRIQSVLTWADLNTGPTGERVGVDERLDEILQRYAVHDPVHAYISEHRLWLTQAGSHPLGLLEHRTQP